MRIYTSMNDSGLIALLVDGAVGVLPTDTVYGLVASAREEAAVNLLFTIKRRDHKPGTVIAATIDQLSELGIKRRYLKAVEQYWPNPLSVLIPCTPGYLSQGLASIAVRIPDDDALLGLLRITGPLMTTSANAPGQPTSTNLAAAQAYFGDRLDFYVDGGELGQRPPSTIIRILDDAVEVVRAGAVTLDENGRLI